MLPLGPGGRLHRRPGGPAIRPPGTRAGRWPEGSTPVKPTPAPARPRRSPGERLADWVAPPRTSRDRDAADRRRRPVQRRLPARPPVPRAGPRRRPGARSPAPTTGRPRTCWTAGARPARRGDGCPGLRDGELRAATPVWHKRYAARPQTQPEQVAAAQIRNGEVVESGQPGRASTARTTPGPTTRAPASPPS